MYNVVHFFTKKLSQFLNFSQKLTSLAIVSYRPFLIAQTECMCLLADPFTVVLFFE